MSRISGMLSDLAEELEQISDMVSKTEQYKVLSRTEEFMLNIRKTALIEAIQNYYELLRNCGLISND